MEAYIYDAVRSPRGRGKADGSLHEITPIQLATQMLEAIRDRNGIDTADVDDVILGCVAPVGEQGTDIARLAVLTAGYADTMAGVQINRFCASGLEAVNMALAKVMTGEAEMVVARRRREHEPRADGRGRRRLGLRSRRSPTPPISRRRASAPTSLPPNSGSAARDVDAYAVESQKRAATAWDEGRFDSSIVPIRDVIGEVVLDHDEHMRPETDMQSLGALKPSFRRDRRGDAGLRCDGAAALSRDRAGQSCPPCRQQLGHRRWRGRRAGRQQGDGREIWPEAPRADEGDGARSVPSR